MMKMASYQLLETRQRFGKYSNVKIEENLYVKSGLLPERYRVKSLYGAPSMVNI